MHKRHKIIPITIFFIAVLMFFSVLTLPNGKKFFFCEHPNLEEFRKCANILLFNFQAASLEDYIYFLRGDTGLYYIHELLYLSFSDIPGVIANQLMRFMLIAFFSAISGFAGFIYRRAFWWWFLVTFIILFGIDWSLSAFLDWDGVKLKNEYITTYQLRDYLWAEVLLIQLLMAFRLRRHSAVAVDYRTKRNGIVLAAILILLAIGWAASPYYIHHDRQWWEFGGTLITLQIAYTILSQSMRSGDRQVKHGKNIVVCLDGTWNEPGTTEFGHVAETNVLKLFKMLKGELQPGNRHKQYNCSQCKEYPDGKQIAFYYQGVGNKLENSELGQLFGGAFGMGASSIVERAYLDVAKVYRQGDRIFIFGFSRGAAIARLLASVIGHRGVPTSMWTLRVFGRNMKILASSRKIDDDQHPVEVSVLGCWDTVGAFGISKNIFGIPFQQMNLLKDLTVSLCVKRAYHMVALDERRDAFVPTLMDADPTDPKRIIEVWFSGSHANVGGGYATDQLSDVTLDFLLKNVSSGYVFDGTRKPGEESWGLYLDAVTKSEGVNGDKVAINPDPKGPIRHSTGAVYSYAPRRVPVHAVIYDSVFERMRNTFPIYAPQSLFNLNNELVTERKKVEEEVPKLRETGSVNPEECTEIVENAKKKLSLTKWSTSELSKVINPEKELRNPFPEEAVTPAA